MLATINQFLKIVPPIVFATIVVVFFAGFLFQSWRLDSANQALGAASLAVDRAAEINAHNSDELTELRSANVSCLSGRRADERRFLEAASGWSGELRALRAERREVRRDEIEIYREPECADFAQLDIASVCPGLARGLRQRSDRLNGIRDG